MTNRVLHNVLSTCEITDILNNYVVIQNKEKLMTSNKVDFVIQVYDTIQSKLENTLGIHINNPIPMRWIKGDTLPHTDKGQSNFINTFLIYITNSIGSLIIDGLEYPITAGDAHIFSEGLEHSTINTGQNERLLIGPMSDSGFRVGAGISIVFSTESYRYDLQSGFSYTANSDPLEITIFNIPPPYPEATDLYNIYVYENPADWTPPSGKIFGGWKLMDIEGNNPIGNNPTSKIYMPGETYEYTQTTFLVPNWIDLPISNICFIGNVSIHTDQGMITIDKINPNIHSIHNKQIVAITKTTTIDSFLVCIEKNSIGNNIPSEKTIVSQDHLIYNKGTMIKAIDFIGMYKNIYTIDYKGDTLYNVLLKDYDTILVNNLICETLHPTNPIAKLYSYILHCDLNEKCNIINAYNKKIKKHRFSLKYNM